MAKKKIYSIPEKISSGKGYPRDKEEIPETDSQKENNDDSEVEEWPDEEDDLGIQIHFEPVPTTDEAFKDLELLRLAKIRGVMDDESLESSKRRLMRFLVDRLLWEDYQ